MTSNINADYLPQLWGRRTKRRNFLLMGSAFSASLILPIVLKSTGLIAANNYENQITKNLTDNSSSKVGFWHSNPSLVENNHLAANMISAQELPSGDLAFAQHGARIKIHGLYLPDSSNLRSLTVHLHYEPRELQAEVKVCAWCYTTEPITSIAPATNFFVPVEQSQGIKLSFEWENSLNASSESKQSLIEKNSLQLSLGNEESKSKLQRGTYLITAQNQSVGELPLWKDYEIKSQELGNENLPHQIFRFDQNHQLVAVDFPYLIISIDYEKETSA